MAARALHGEAGWKLPRRWLRAVMVSAFLAAIAYLGFSLWGGWREIGNAILRIGLSGFATMLALSLVNYGLRFVRWQSYLRALGHDVPTGASARIYLAGFALTTTPGKADEAIRGLFLRDFGVPHATALAAFVSERLSDLLAIATIALLYVCVHHATPAAVLGAVAMIGMLFALVRFGLFRWIQARVVRLARGGALVAHGMALIADLRRCHAWRLFLFATTCSLVAWSAEALALALLLDWLGFDCPTSFAMFTYAFAMLAGAVSMIPGGLGGTEAVMIALLVSAGMRAADAGAATVAIRLCTLWFAVLLGAVALAAQNRAHGRIARG